MITQVLTKITSEGGTEWNDTDDNSVSILLDDQRWATVALRWRLVRWWIKENLLDWILNQKSWVREPRKSKVHYAKHACCLIIFLPGQVDAFDVADLAHKIPLSMFP